MTISSQQMLLRYLPEYNLSRSKYTFGNTSLAIQHSEERRRAQRIPVLVRVECRTPRNYILANCENISETGMLIHGAQTFAVSQEVTLRFVLPPVTTGRVIQTDGVIVRAEEGRYMAVEFTKVRPPFRETIAKYVEQKGVRNR